MGGGVVAAVVVVIYLFLQFCNFILHMWKLPLAFTCRH